MPAVAVTFMLMLGIGASQSLASERVNRVASAIEKEPAAEKPRKRRRRRHSGRPTSADDAVTPPAEFDLPWMRPGAAAGVPQEFVKPAPQMPLALERGPAPPSDILPEVLQRRADPHEGPLGPLFSPTAKHWGDADGVAPRRETTVAQDEAIAAEGGTDSYRAALARWHTLRQAAGAPGRPEAIPSSPPDLPASRDVWGASGTRPPSDGPIRATAEELPPIVDATVPQPPMPPAWPGEARQPDGEPISGDDGPADPPGNVVHLPRSRRP
jgi:hypothetical protein